MNADYAAVASALADLSQRVAALAQSPAAADLPKPYVRLDVQPGGYPITAADAARVDAVAAALLGTQPVTMRMSDGMFHRHAAADVGAVRASVYGQVPAPSTASVRAAEAIHRWGLAS